MYYYTNSDHKESRARLTSNFDSQTDTELPNFTYILYGAAMNELGCILLVPQKTLYQKSRGKTNLELAVEKAKVFIVKTF